MQCKKGEPRTANRRSVWLIQTQAYRDSHFATFPPKLVEPMILAGTSAKGCCPACGAPWERVVERATSAPQRIGGDNNWHKMNQSNHRAGGYYDAIAATTGWQPTCTCNAGVPVPATVLDCFGGSGTTAAVALQHGRNAILCELNPAYAKMAVDRIGKATHPATYRDESRADGDTLFEGERQ